MMQLPAATAATVTPLPKAVPASKRVAAIDWMRGLVMVLMAHPNSVLKYL